MLDSLPPDCMMVNIHPGDITYYLPLQRRYSLCAGNPGDYVAPEVVRYLLDAEEKLNEKMSLQ